MSGSELRDQPTDWIAGFSRSLREEGVPCTLHESFTACAALDELDAADAFDVYFGLKASFTSSAEHEPAFDRVFWRFWGEHPQPRDGGSRTDGHRSAGVEAGGPRAGAAEQSLLGSVRQAEPPDEARGSLSPESAGASYSATERLARRSFERLNEQELRRVDRIFDRIMLRLATRRSRRYRPHPRKGRLDLRRSLRSTVEHDGELLRLARRRRREERPRVVLLCDVSGSMERYSRFLLRFLLAAGRERDVESLVFSTRLTRLTPWLSASRVDHALDAIGDRVHHWSSGTRIGECLDEFVRKYGRSLLGQKTVVVILSDGLDRGDVELLDRAMAALHRKARKVIWLNPLLAGAEYQPVARGMRAALPHVDVFAPGHNVRSLLQLERHLTLA